MHVLQSKEIFS